MRTFPATPSLQSDQLTRLLADSSGLLGVTDAGLGVGPSASVTPRGAHDVACDQRVLSAELEERRRQLIAERDEAWAPLDLATIVHCHVPRSAAAHGTFVFLFIPVVMFSYLTPAAGGSIFGDSSDVE